MSHRSHLPSFPHTSSLTQRRAGRNISPGRVGMGRVCPPLLGVRAFATSLPFRQQGLKAVLHGDLLTSGGGGRPKEKERMYAMSKISQIPIFKNTVLMEQSHLLPDCGPRMPTLSPVIASLMTRLKACLQSRNSVT